MKRIAPIMISAAAVILVSGCATLFKAQYARKSAQASEEFQKVSAYFWDKYEDCKISPINPAMLKHADLRRSLEEIEAKFPGLIEETSPLVADARR